MTKQRIATIVLDYPVQLADRELTELIMRRPTLDEEIKFSPASRNIREQSEEEAKYFAHLCSISREEFGKIDLQDYGKVQQQYLLFRGRTPTDGGVKNDSSGAESAGSDSTD